MFSNYKSYYKEPEQRCMTNHCIKNNPLSSFENKQRNFSNISYMVFYMHAWQTLNSWHLMLFHRTTLCYHLLNS
jgi:hypothetical protein